MAKATSRRFVMVAPPTQLSAIGEALRAAFARPELRSSKVFDRLLERLNRMK